jgi:hypothetical protein
MPDNRFPELRQWGAIPEEQTAMHEKVVQETKDRLPSFPTNMDVRTTGHEFNIKGPYEAERQRIIQILSADGSLDFVNRTPLKPPPLPKENRSADKSLYDMTKKALNMSGAIRNLANIEKMPGKTRAEKFQYALNDYKWVPLLICVTVLIIVLFVLRYAL